jgi:hypothetical protein
LGVFFTLAFRELEFRRTRIPVEGISYGIRFMEVMIFK